MCTARCTAISCCAQCAVHIVRTADRLPFAISDKIEHYIASTTSSSMIFPKPCWFYHSKTLQPACFGRASWSATSRTQPEHCCATNLSSRSFSSASDKVRDLTLELTDSEEYAFARELMRIPGTKQRLFLIQPRVKWGPRRNMLTTPALQMEENKTLVETLGWEVVDSIILPVDSLDSPTVFGKGNFEKLQEAIRSHSGTNAVSGIFFGANIMNLPQLRKYRETFHMPVYDRYRIVLEIFRSHARTKEAKLQVALAELPYLRAAFEGSGENVSSIQPQSASSSGQTWSGLRRQLIRDREGKIKTALDRIRSNRAVNRQNRIANAIPSIAIVGYTNCGKTSLIKTLTGDASLVPENKLFATLDVTSHAGRLPNNVTLLYVDTVGFISDIPTTLISSFAAVLEEIAVADVIVHVRDISHPDTKLQKETVLQQLLDLKLPENLLANVIEVCNKCDQIPDLEAVKKDIVADENAVFTSALTGEGVYELRERMQSVLLGTSNLMEKSFRVPQSGKELRWLYKEAHVHYAEADPTDSEFLIVHATITPPSLAKFVHEFRRVFFMDKKSEKMTRGKKINETAPS